MKMRETKQFRVAPVRNKQAIQPSALENKQAEERLDADVTFKLTQSELDALNDMAWQLRTSRSALIRQFIAEGMERISDS